MRVASWLFLAGTPLLLSGCATGMAGSARRICYDTGLQPGTPEFSSCWKGVRDQQFATDGRMIEGLVATAIVVGAARVAAENSTVVNAEPRPNRSPQPAPNPVRAAPYVPSSSSRALPSYNGGTPNRCPDGKYVVGMCTIAPDGSYVGDQPQIAPDGTYVGGMPRLTPNGTYVGGTGPLTICPDGSYVAGTSCRLMPDGRYVGQP